VILTREGYCFVGDTSLCKNIFSVNALFVGTTSSQREKRKNKHADRTILRVNGSVRECLKDKKNIHAHTHPPGSTPTHTLTPSRGQRNWVKDMLFNNIDEAEGAVFKENQWSYY
jgi:hypothetical protein